MLVSFSRGFREYQVKAPVMKPSILLVTDRLAWLIPFQATAMIEITQHPTDQVVSVLAPSPPIPCS